MAVEEILRLAWEADHLGQPGLRDALLTLAAVESGPGDAWASACRDRLVASKPNHFLAAFATIREALADPRVRANRDRLRSRFPEVRVGRLLLGAGVARGRFTGRSESIGPIIEDLFGPWMGRPLADASIPDSVRVDQAQAPRGPLVARQVGKPALARLLYPAADPAAWSPSEPPRDDPRLMEDRAEPGHLYLAVLFAIAFLCESVERGRMPS